jgi:hypothetical protein
VPWRPPAGDRRGLAVHLGMAAINPRNSMMWKLKSEGVVVACMYTIAVSGVQS